MKDKKTVINKYYVYRHFIGENTFYIGSNWSKGNPNRAYEIQKRDRTKIWNNYVASNGGSENVQIEIIEYFDSKKEAYEKEMELINYYRSIGQAEANNEGLKGENHPRYGVRPSEETREKIRLNHADFSGENHPRYGMKASKETCEKISSALRKYKDVLLYDEEVFVGVFSSTKDVARYLKEAYELPNSFASLEKSARNSLTKGTKIVKRFNLRLQ